MFVLSAGFPENRQAERPPLKFRQPHSVYASIAPSATHNLRNLYAFSARRVVESIRLTGRKGYTDVFDRQQAIGDQTAHDLFHG